MQHRSKPATYPYLVSITAAVDHSFSGRATEWLIKQYRRQHLSVNNHSLHGCRNPFLPTARTRRTANRGMESCNRAFAIEPKILYGTIQELPQIARWTSRCLLPLKASMPAKHPGEHHIVACTVAAICVFLRSGLNGTRIHRRQQPRLCCCWNSSLRLFVCITASPTSCKCLAEWMRMPMPS